MSYYDVDAILTDAQKVPCTFELTVPGLGYLEGNMTGDMKKGSKIELPLWLGEMLALSQSLNTQSLVTLDPPSALSPRVLNALKADPRTVNLRALAPHFYNLGARILELFDEEEMIEVLSDVCIIQFCGDETCLIIGLQTYKARAAVIADQAHNPRGALGEGADFMRGLDENERQCEC